MDFNYPHFDSSRPERPSRTSNLNKLCVSGLVNDIRKEASLKHIPVSTAETLQFLCLMATAVKARKMLEVGTAVGASGIALLEACPAATLTTIEKNADFAAAARANFVRAGVEGRVSLMQGDAAEILPQLEGGYDFIFLDGPKVQYVKWLPRLKELLAMGGMLLADDVLLFGWVNGEEQVPPKRKMLVQHVREYLDAVQADSRLITYIADIGDGISISVKK